MGLSASNDHDRPASAAYVAESARSDQRDARVGSRDGRRAATPEERRNSLLIAAEDAFTRKGFSATTMDEIASAVGMSKKTVYKLFASKNDLFRAMIQRRAPEHRNHAVPDSPEDAVEQLRFWLRWFGRIVFSPREIALQRLMVREAQITSDLAEIFADVIIDPGPPGLTECVKGLRLLPALRLRPPREVAEMFIGVVYGSTHFKLMISDTYRPDPSTIEERIDLAVALFCEEH